MGSLCWFHFGAIMNIHTQGFMWTYVPFGNVSNSGPAGLYYNSKFNFEERADYFPSDWAIYYSQQLCLQIPGLLYPCQHFLLSVSCTIVLLQSQQKPQFRLPMRIKYNRENKGSTTGPRAVDAQGGSSVVLYCKVWGLMINFYQKLKSQQTTQAMSLQGRDRNKWNFQ